MPMLPPSLLGVKVQVLFLHIQNTLGTYSIRAEGKYVVRRIRFLRLELSKSNYRFHCAALGEKK